LDARENLGILLLESGRPDEAKPHLERVVAGAPQRHRAHYHLLKILHPDVIGSRR
jgi:hypothetical protein